jgi:hypothetical protein
MLQRLYQYRDRFLTVAAPTESLAALKEFIAPPKGISGPERPPQQSEKAHNPLQ